MRRILAFVLLLAGPLTACGSSSSATSCQAAHETLDPGSAIHLLPAAPDPSYLSNPPTSGPHQLTGLASIPRGVLSQPVPARLQIAMLEKGGVLIQYQTPSYAPLLAPLATGKPLVALAPGATLPAPVVVTAWTWKMTCTTADPTAVTKFIATHQGHGPGTP
jgi:hypothetical protein